MSQLRLYALSGLILLGLFLGLALATVPGCGDAAPAGGDAGMTCAAGEVCEDGGPVGFLPDGQIVSDGDARLSSLTISEGMLGPAFSPDTTMYVVSVKAFTTSLTVTPTAAAQGATITVNGSATASGSASSAIALAIGAATQITLEVTATSGATRSYTIVVMRGGIRYLKASNTGVGDAFGTSIALSGDTLAIGATDESSNATGVNGDQANDGASNSGAVYVFVRTGESWTQQAYLKASNTQANDGFGYRVALSGDTIAVSALQEASNATGVNGNQTDNSAAGSGAVYVFTRTGTTWSQQAYLKASNTQSTDGFGYSLALSGDTLAVGSEDDSNATGVDGNAADNSASLSGSVHVFARTGTTWIQQAYLKASNTNAFDDFGFSVALSGDTLAVGALGEKSNATGVDGNQADNSLGTAGAVYVFARTGTTWSQQAYLKASNTAAGDAFGYSVALSGDTLAVSAYGEDSDATGVNGDQASNAASDSGAVYVFSRTGTTWTQQAYLKASNTGDSDRFGRVALSGDVLVVGTGSEDSAATGVNGSQADNSAVGSGAAYVFVRTGTSWAQRAYLKATNTEANDYFGDAVAVSGTTIAITAHDEDSAATGVDGNQADNSTLGSGAAYTYSF